MTIRLPNNRLFYLEPGYIFCTGEAATVNAVLGSSVAVCLWDRQLRFGGMNHFLFPRAGGPEEATACYGNVSTAALVRMMEKAGARRRNMLGQVLGGGRPFGSPDGGLGEKNVEAARAALRQKGVVISSEDVGGHMGRKVVFDTRTGHLMVLKVHRIRATDWLTEDHTYESWLREERGR